MRAQTDRLAGHDAMLAEAHQNAPFRYSYTVFAVHPREGLRHEARQDVELMWEKVFELERRFFGLLQRAILDWIGIGHRHVRRPPRCRMRCRLRPCGAARENHGRRSLAAQRRWQGAELAGCAAVETDRHAPRAVRSGGQREHSIATNSSWLGPLVGTAPVISSRSTLRKLPACANSRDWQ